MTNKGVPQLFRIGVDISGKEESDGEPDIIRGDFNISMMVIGLEEGLKKSIVKPWVKWSWTALCIVDEFSFLVVVEPTSSPVLLHSTLVVKLWLPIAVILKVLEMDYFKGFVLHIKY